MGLEAGGGCVAGAVAGFMVGGPVGALIGAVIGGEVGRSSEQTRAEERKRKQEALSSIHPSDSPFEVAHKLEEAGLSEVEFKEFLEAEHGGRSLTDERRRKVMLR